MEKQIIHEQFKNSPGIIYYPDNNRLEIYGRSIPEDPDVIYTGLINWLTNHFENEKKLSVSIKLEYINSGSSKYLSQIFKRLTDYLKAGNQVRIKWICEADDESMVDLGENFRNMSGIPLEIERIP